MRRTRKPIAGWGAAVTLLFASTAPAYAQGEDATREIISTVGMGVSFRRAGGIWKRAGMTGAQPVEVPADAQCSVAIPEEATREQALRIIDEAHRLRIGGICIHQCASVDDEVLRRISRLDHLEFFQFLGELPLQEFAPQFTSDGFQVSSRLGSLRELVLVGMPLNDRQLGFLSSMKELEDLDLVMLPIDGRFLHGVEGKSLRRLRLVPKDGIDDTALESIAKFRRLDTLELYGTTGHGLSAIPKGQVPLRTLHMSSSDLDDDSLEGIGVFPDLETLDISHCTAVRGEGLAVLSSLKKLKVLRWELGYIQQGMFLGLRLVHDDGAFRHLRACESLEVIELDERPVTRKELELLLELPKLRKLSIRGCIGVDAGCIAELRKAHPGCAIDH